MVESTLAAVTDELGSGSHDPGRTQRVVAIVARALGALEAEIEARTRQLAEQRHFMEKIVDSLPLGLYVVDREYRVQTWNRKRESGLQGISREDAMGRTIFEILHRQPSESLRREFDAVFDTGELQQFETESRAGGEPRAFRISKIPMRVSDGAVTHVITVGEDITEGKAAQHRAAQSEKMAAIGQLAAGVMHEINNPLATISACAESITMQLKDLQGTGVTLPRDCLEYLQYIETEVHRCKGIIDGLLDFGRTRPTAKSIIDLNDVIERAVFLVSHHERVKKQQLHVDLDHAPGAGVFGNTERLIQVFIALVLNAADALGEQTGRDSRGSITLRTRRSADGGTMVAEVIDDGPGIARAALPKLFEPFYTTKPPGRGTGLGLSICYGIVADHGGRMEVDSTVGMGSTFRTIFPVSPV
jgi:two-component system, NtrC family, sensor kinase